MYNRSFTGCVVLLSLAVVVVHTTDLRKVPDFIHVCHRHDPDYDGCLLRTTNLIAPYLKRGIPEMNIPSTEPLEIKEFLVSEKSRSNAIRVSAKDLRIYNGSNFVANSIRMITFGEEYQIEIQFPDLYVTGTYEINGQIIVLPIHGTGPMRATFENPLGRARVKFGTRTIDGKRFLTNKQFKCKVQFNGGHIQLDNLFNGDKTLGAAVNDAINSNLDILSEDFKPLIENSFSKIFNDIVEKIVSNYTFEQLFPE